MRDRRANFQLFIFACLMAAVVVLAGLRWYFSQAEVEKRLRYTIAGTAFETVVGQSVADSVTGVLQVNTDGEQSGSLIRLSGLAVEPDIYDRLEVVFAEKASQQTLTLTATGRQQSYWQRQAKQPVRRAQTILYTDEQTVSRFDMSVLTASGETLTELQLATSRLMIPYRLRAVRFVPKHYDMLQLLSLLRRDFTRVTPSHLDKGYYLLSAKWLLILYFTAVFFIYAALLLRIRRSAMTAWWWVLVLAWALLDLRHWIYHSRSIWQVPDTATVAVNAPEASASTEPNRDSLLVSHPLSAQAEVSSKAVTNETDEAVQTRAETVTDYDIDDIGDSGDNNYNTNRTIENNRHHVSEEMSDKTATDDSATKEEH